MRKIIIASLVAALGVVPLQSQASMPAAEPEGCGVVNPGMPSCSFTVAEGTEYGGAAGFGTWKVTIKRGKKKTVVAGAGITSGEVGSMFTLQKGDKVTVQALEPGSGAIAGGE